MNNFIQSIESKRFFKVVDELIKREILKNDRAFCQAIGYSVASFSQIRNAKRDVNVELISHLVTLYKGNPIFIFTGKGEPIMEKMIESDNKSTFSETEITNSEKSDDLINSLRQENEWRKKLLEQYFKQGELNINYTKALEEQNKELLRELGRSVKK